MGYIEGGQDLLICEVNVVVRRYSRSTRCLILSTQGLRLRILLTLTASALPKICTSSSSPYNKDNIATIQIRLARDSATVVNYLDTFYTNDNDTAPSPSLAYHFSPV
jgi:hypothetical protein